MLDAIDMTMTAPVAEALEPRLLLSGCGSPMAVDPPGLLAVTRIAVMADPALARYASRYASFASQPLFTDGPQYSDIRQGSLGDCYYLATLASLADADPSTIRHAIRPLPDGTYLVRFYRNGSPVYVRIDADLPVTSGGSLVYARLSATGEMWVPLMEKAYAWFRTGANAYASIELGWLDEAYASFGHGSLTTYTFAPDAVLYAALSTGRAAAESRVGASGPIIASHAYAVMAAFNADGAQYVQVYNPWGTDGTMYDANPCDGLVMLTFSQFKVYFTAIVAEAAVTK